MQAQNKTINSLRLLLAIILPLIGLLYLLWAIRFLTEPTFAKIFGWCNVNNECKLGSVSESEKQEDALIREQIVFFQCSQEEADDFILGGDKNKCVEYKKSLYDLEYLNCQDKYDSKEHTKDTGDYLKKACIINWLEIENLKSINKDLTGAAGN